MLYTFDVADQYQKLFDTATVVKNGADIEKAAKTILANKATYQQIVQGSKIPWYFVGLVHMLESSFNFSKHLHNGDPLTGRTFQVPAGRPIAPPANGKSYTFIESAKDALGMPGKEFFSKTDWSLPRILYRLEAFNGFGYRGKGINSPYLWSDSNHYTKGKYVRDGVYSADAVSQQTGSAVVLKRLSQLSKEVADSLLIANEAAKAAAQKKN